MALTFALMKKNIEIKCNWAETIKDEDIENMYQYCVVCI